MVFFLKKPLHSSLTDKYGDQEILQWYQGAGEKWAALVDEVEGSTSVDFRAAPDQC